MNVMHLAEIIGGLSTSDETIQIIEDVSRKMGKGTHLKDLWENRRFVSAPSHPAIYLEVPESVSERKWSTASANPSPLSCAAT
jgi:hypothetical protein